MSNRTAFWLLEARRTGWRDVEFVDERLKFVEAKLASRRRSASDERQEVARSQVDPTFDIAIDASASTLWLVRAREARAQFRELVHDVGACRG